MLLFLLVPCADSYFKRQESRGLIRDGVGKIDQCFVGSGWRERRERGEEGGEGREIEETERKREREGERGRDR